MRKITIVITDEQHRKLSELSKEKEVKVSEQIRRAIDGYLEEA
jgi:hypothetical protein